MSTTPIRQAAVLGSPVAHSLSPVIHNAGYAAARLTNWHYGAHECSRGELAEFVRNRDPSWAGLSLTMPLKEVALNVASEASALAEMLGAANTLVRRVDGTWFAENTDAPGMVDALAEVGVTTAASVAILGAGGTARAALAAARDLGATTVTCYARRPQAVADLGDVARALGVSLAGGDWAHAVEAGQADVVFATVPRGVADPLAPAMTWRAGCVLFDALYVPWPTPLAQSALAAGLPVVSGLELLLAQAARQFELFTGVSAPVEPMRDALLSAIRDAEAGAGRGGCVRVWPSGPALA